MCNHGQWLNKANVTRQIPTQIHIFKAKSSMDKSITFEIYIFRDEGMQKVTQQEAPFDIGANKKILFHIFSDRSIIEVFVNEQICLTQRIYPTRNDSQGIKLFAEGGEVQIPELNAWKMQPSNPW